MESTKQPTFFRVTFIAALVLLIETVLFHIVNIVHEFFAATAVISYAVLGLGLGAFVAGRVRARSENVFTFCTAGTTIGLYLISVIITQYPAQYAIAAGTALCVFFPTVYLTVQFREHPGGRLYMFDMAGAFLGVAITVLFYMFLTSESIVLLTATVIPLVGALSAAKTAMPSARSRKVALAVSIPLAVLGATLFVFHLATDRLNLAELYRQDRDTKTSKVFGSRDKTTRLRTYDSLVGRIDVYKASDGNQIVYDGYPNDHFEGTRAREYDYFEKLGQKWRTNDLRVFPGFAKDPEFFIIGSAAQGIIKTVKKFTPVNKITTVEIQPAILDIMTRHYYKASGRAYSGLKPVQGNAISYLKASSRKFDAITLINTHSGFNLGWRAGPDYLHTAEHYRLYFDHLTDNGFLMFEERPTNRGGALALFRVLNTLWSVIAENGSPDPSKHFFIWEWAGNKLYPNITHDYDVKRDKYVQGSGWYIGMVVAKSPIVGEKRKEAIDWYHQAAGVGRLVYLKDYLEFGQFSDVFDMIEKRDFSPLAGEGYDPSIVTDDRPFPSLSRTSVPEVEELLISSAALFALLASMLAFSTLRNRPKGKGAFLILYNVLIGFGYFFIEIILMQVYQNVFLSASWSLILILGLLLLSSGLGGNFGGKLPSWAAASLLIPAAIVAISIPNLILSTGLPIEVGKVLGVAFIMASGFLMGVFFPRGLVIADGWSFRDRVPHLFALNSVAGSLAVVLALFLGIKIGYRNTIFGAILCYCVAGLMLSRAQKER